MSFRVSAAAGAAAACLLSVSGARAQTFQEYDSQWNLQAVGVQAAWSRGYTGAGVIVGVIDSGADAAHPELQGQLTPFSYDVFTGGPGVIDEHGHGSHVAGTIAAARNGRGMVGVAYDARLSILRYLDANNTGSDDPEALPFLYNQALDHGVRLFNNSWGGGFLVPDADPEEVVAFIGGDEIAAYRRAAALDSILVWATGNETLDQPGLQASLPYYLPELQPHWIAVTATNSRNTLAGYANKCGLAAAWCMAAPGGDFPAPGEADEQAGIISLAPGARLVPNAGTSMAAPHVSGAVAIARQMYPHAPAAALSRLTLATATDIGAPGVDDVYGWGLLNIGNLARTRDAEAAQTFADAGWAGREGRAQVLDLIATRAGSDGRGGWAAATGRRAEHDAAGGDVSTLTLATGADLFRRDDAAAGAALYRTEAEVEPGVLDNRARLRAIGAAVYGQVAVGRWFARAAAAAERVEQDVRRRDIPGTGDTVLAGAGALSGRSETSGEAAAAQLDVGAVVEIGSIAARPLLFVRADHQALGGFAETGADVFSLEAAEQSHTQYAGGPGLELALAPIRVAAAELRATVAARYAFGWGDDDAYRADLLGSPVVARLPGAMEGPELSAQLDARIDPGATAFVRAGWRGGHDHDGHGLSAGLAIAF